MIKSLNIKTTLTMRHHKSILYILSGQAYDDSINGNLNISLSSYKDTHYMDTDVDDQMLQTLRYNWYEYYC